MKRVLAFLAVVSLTALPAQVGMGAETTASDGDITPAVAKIADFAKSSGMKMLLFFELDDARAGEPIEGIGILGQPPGSTALVMYRGNLSEFMNPLASEAKASGWRWIRIVAHNDTVVVGRGPTLGPIEGFNARLRAEADRAFPGHTSLPE